MRVRKPDLFLNLDQHKLVAYHVHAMLIFRQFPTQLPLDRWTFSSFLSILKS
jgi:hypothetical protein